MSEWLWYSPGEAGTRVIEFDADYAEPQARAGLTELVDLVLTGYETDDAGLPADDAVDGLFKLEERIGAVAGEAGGAFVADIAENNTYRLLVYLPQSGLADRFQSTIGSTFACRIEAKSDPQWGAYEAVALRGEELEALRDREQVDEIDDSGVEVTGDLDITFDYEFADAESARRAYHALRQAGYDLPELGAGVIDDESPGFGLTVSCALDADDIGEARRKTSALVAPYGGEFAGWGYDPDDRDVE